jgi:sugar lactone lactonase YvrE
MTYFKGVSKYNKGDCIYINGDEFIEGSRRFSIDSETGFPEIQKLIEGIWQPSSLETGADTLWIGRNAGMAGVGPHLAIETRDGHLRFIPHTEFKNGVSTAELQIIDAYAYSPRMVYQSDESGSFTGKLLELSIYSPARIISNNVYYKTHSTAATKPVRIQIWKGNDDTRLNVFDQIYPASQFPADSEVQAAYSGYIEYEEDATYFVRYSSDGDFSFKMDATNTNIWIAADTSFIKEDQLLQTEPYEDGGTYELGQWLIRDRKIYICNTSGVQNGTFAENSAKWDLLGSSGGYISDLKGATAGQVAFGSDLGNGLETGSALTFDGSDLSIADGGLRLARTGNNPFIHLTYNGSSVGQIRANADVIRFTSATGSTDYLVIPTVSDVPMKLMPKADGDVDCFGVSEVADNEDGRDLRIWRRAPEGDESFRLYITASRTGMIHSSNDLTMQGQATFTINSVTKDINLKVGDANGSKKVYFKDSNGVAVAFVDSNGNLWVSSNITVDGLINGIDIEALDAFVDTKAPQDSPSFSGGVTIANSLNFHDNSTQCEAAERVSCVGHTHTAVLNGYYDSSAENIAERDLTFSWDGEKMYIVGITNGGVGNSTIWEYPLTTPWDLSTVGSPTTKDIDSDSTNATGIHFATDGRTMYLCDAGDDTVTRWTSILAWNLATFNLAESFDVSAWETSPDGVVLSPDGTRMYVIGTGSKAVQQFSLSTPWELGDVIHVNTFGTDIDNPTAVRFSSDGRRMYVMDGSAEDDIHEYHLHTPWMVSTAVLVNLFNVNAENGSPQGLYVRSDNSTIYMVGTSTPEGVYAYDLGLEVKGSIISTNGAVQAGSMTTTQRDALAAVNGMMIYNTTLNKFQGYENSAWVNLI